MFQDPQWGNEAVLRSRAQWSRCLSPRPGQHDLLMSLTFRLTLKEAAQITVTTFRGLLMENHRLSNHTAFCN